jgi:hypothetical protein
MKKVFATLILLSYFVQLQAQTNPAITAWLRNVTNIKGRHYVQGNPTPIQDNTSANIQSVQYSSSWAYVAATGIPAYISGPFFGNPSIATAQTGYFKIPLNPVKNNGTPSPTTGGNIGAFINGVALFDYRDGVAWNTATNSLCGGPGNPACPGGMGTVQPWTRDAVPAEKIGFDCAKGHPANGNYHHHQNPSAFNLDLMVISNICDVYLADGLYKIDSTKHSPLIGFAYDGFPIYGAYAYKNADGTGVIVRIKSSYKLRNITVRTHHADGTDVADGPNVSTTYPLGYFREDYEYTPTSPATPDRLDEHNGRFCITPEYPQGTYAYFATVNQNWNSAYPYVVGPTFYGVKNASKVQTIAEPVTTYNGPLLTSSTAISQVDCFGNATGAITLTAIGGNPPYTFNWGNGITTQNRSGLMAGTYIVTITDITAQTTTQSVAITQPALAISASATATGVACFGESTGSIQLTPAGGTTGYTFVWSDGNTDQNRSALAAGSYTVTVSDANHCSTALSQNITQPQAALNASVMSTNVACFGSQTGAIQLNMNGGTGPYTFAWSDGNTNQNRNALAAGTYTVTVSDANHCTASGQLTISQPLEIATIATTMNATCGETNGSVSILVNGGVPPYAYVWSTGDSAQNLSNLSSGSYTVTITDQMACTAISTGLVSNLNGPNTSLEATPVTCFGEASGACSLLINGGTAPFTFLWSDGETTQNRSGLVAGTYSVSIQDANGCNTIASQIIEQPSLIVLNGLSSPDACGMSIGAISLEVEGGISPYTFGWSNGATVQSPGNLAAGDYTVLVSDDHGCTMQFSTTVGVHDALSGVTIPTPVKCFGEANGAIQLSLNTGTAPFTYLWSNGSNTQHISDLTAGTFVVTVTDANGCSVSLVQEIVQPELLSASTIPTHIDCFGNSSGAIELTTLGGTAPYSFDWGGGIHTQNLSNVPAGTYTVIILDGNGCSTTLSQVLTAPLAPILLNLNATPSTPANDGTLSANATGGTPPYTFEWSNGFSGDQQDNIAPGMYTVTIMDANACTTSGSETVDLTSTTSIALGEVSLNVFPNPGTDILIIQANGLLRNSLRLSLCNTSGQVLLAQELPEGSTISIFDTQILYDGTYFLTVSDGNTAKTFKVIIQR